MRATSTMNIWFTVSVFTSLMLFLGGVDGWPEGTYGLPMAASGCPVTENFEWEEGSRTQNTEDDSYASNPIHLAGITPQKTDSVVQNFCMKTSYTQDGDHLFTKGQYCLFKKGDCPSGFKEGWIYWDDDSTFIWDDDIQNVAGTLPDGEYDSNTKIFYCCRNDGPASNVLKLPTESPFFLFKMGEECQQVMGMDSAEEWVYWSDEATLNLNGKGGLHPYVQRSRYPWRYTKLFYCYYTKRGVNNNVQTAMTVIYILAGAVGLILLILFIVCIMQKICTYKSDPDADHHATESMLQSNAPTAATELEPSVIYRPSNGLAKVQEAQEPPRYSTLDQVNGQVPSAPPMDTESSSIPQPPSYEEVLQEKNSQSPNS